MTYLKVNRHQLNLVKRSKVDPSRDDLKLLAFVGSGLFDLAADQDDASLCHYEVSHGLLDPLK